MPATRIAMSLVALTICGISAYGLAARPLPAHLPAPHRPADSPHVTTRLIVGSAPLVPGQVAELGIHLKIEPGWHIYWDGQNDTGLPVSAKYRLPAGFEAGPVLWPAPQRHLAHGTILDHTYEDEVTLIVPVRVPADAKPGPVDLSVDLEWLVCKNICQPEEGRAELTVPVGPASSKPTATPDAKLLEQARARLPRPLPEGPSAPKVTWNGDRLILAGAAAGRIEFYPGPASSRVANLAENGASDKGRLQLGFEAKPPLRAQGVLAIWPEGGGRAEYYQIDLAQPGAAAPDAK